MYTVLTCLLLLTCWCREVSSDCPYKECNCYDTIISCPGRGLTSMPIFYSTETTGYLTLNLDENNITEISAGSLPAGLTDISINNNPITTIDDNAFDQLSTTLQALYFSNARLVRIRDAFLHLNALQHLNIISTHVTDWNIGAMAHLGETLQTINIEQVGFAIWPVWLAYYNSLTELSLQSNAISSIPDSAFDNLSKNLQVLTLSNNSLTATPKALTSLNNIVSLDLQFNKISNVTWLPQSSKLSSLALNYNQISDTNHISNVLRPYANSLDTVLLTYNLMPSIPDLSFLTRIDTFDLSYNRISDPSSGNLHNATYMLDLSFNLLPSIPVIYRVLPMMSSMTLTHNLIHVVQGAYIPPWITDLYLDVNLITELTDTSFPESSSLQLLVLDSNPLVKISSSAFKNLKSLNNLSLQNTKLNRLPLTLSHLTHILFLELGNNPYLVCTCLEKSLKEKITSNIFISGNCGNINIYNFFAMLSSDCP